MSETKVTIIDASGLILGRLASIVFKRFLSVNRIIIINIEKASVSGAIRRAIRGMLPWDKQKVRAAYRRLRVYLSVPAKVNEEYAQTLPEAKTGESDCL